MISSNKAIEILDLCIMRQDAKRKCVDCIYYGAQCIEAHQYGALAARVMLRRDVMKEAEHERQREIDEGNA